MLSKAVNGFTATEVDRVFQAIDLPELIRIRAELLDLDNVFLYDLCGLLQEGTISFNIDQPMQGGADLRFLQKERDYMHPSPLGSFASLVTAQNRIFWLRLNETSGNATDSSGNGHTFTANGGITYSVGSLGAGTTDNKAVTLNGTTGYYSIADGAWMDVSALTLVIAMKGTGATDTLIDRNDGGSNKFWRLEVDANGNVALTMNFTSGLITTYTALGCAVNDGEPHLIHATYDGTAIKIYVDGKRLLRTAETRTMLTGTLGINIGRNLAGANFFAGTIDEVGMLGRALTPVEIRNEYQAWNAQTTELLLDKDRGDRIKIYYGVRMPRTGTDGSDTAEWPQIVAIITSHKDDLDSEAQQVVISIAGQDQTRVLQDYSFSSVITLASGANYISGTNGVLSIAQQAGLMTTGWSVTATTLTAPADIPFEVGQNALEAINYLLTAINYRPIRFSGTGSAIIEPNVLDKNLPVVDSINSNETKVIEAANLGLELEPRKVVRQVIIGNGNPDVTPIRGESNSGIYITGETVAYQVDVPDQNTATALAEQTLTESIAKTAKRIKFRTLPRPIHEGRDRYAIRIDEIDIDEDFIESEWRLPLDPSGLMEHSMYAVKEIC